MVTPDIFINKRFDDWEMLESLLKKSKNKSNLTPEDVTEIGRLYRTTVTDLAVAQRDYPMHPIGRYLNQLTARAHTTLYRETPFSAHQAKRLFTHVIPQTIRSTWGFFAVMLALFFIPALIVGIATAVNPDLFDVLVPEGMQGIKRPIEEHEQWFYSDDLEQPADAALITTNNIQVSFYAFAGGLTGGLLTLYIMIYNGLMFGGVSGYAIHHDFWDLINFMSSHGPIELSMIALAGAAGLVLAWAIIRPGQHSRADALRLAGQKALIMIFTVSVMLVISGLIEGLLSTVRGIPWVIRWMVGLGSGGLMYAYFIFAGREEKLESLRE